MAYINYRYDFMNYIRKFFDLESLIWFVILCIVAIQNPYSETHFTLFWPSLFFDIKSPGYNIGHSMSFFFRGEIIKSIDAHILGIPCIFILISRIIYQMKFKYDCLKIIEKRGN